MAEMIFNESTMYNGNIFKFENRLKSSLNRYTENGALFVTYYSQDENSSTVDRGLQDIETLFGKRAPLRYNKIEHFPVYGFGRTDPENTDEQQIEDINVNGDCIILPSTIVPKPVDFFIIEHLKMNAIFEVVEVIYDSMKSDGSYKIRYRLHSTSHETIQKINQQVVGEYVTQLDSIGTSTNPIISKENAATKSQIIKMVNKMISSYRAMFYDERHNCFLYREEESGLDWFDMCGNEFMMKYSLMNYENSSKVIVLSHKIEDKQFTRRYHNSIYSWIELGAPLRFLRKFEFVLDEASTYPYSSFAQWGDVDIQIIQPLSTQENGIITNAHYFFDDVQFNAFLDPNIEPYNEYEKLIWKFIHRTDLTMKDISLYTADALITSVKHIDLFLYTPIIIYIIRHILEMD